MIYSNISPWTMQIDNITKTWVVKVIDTILDSVTHFICVLPDPYHNAHEGGRILKYEQIANI